MIGNAQIFTRTSLNFGFPSLCAGNSAPLREASFELQQRAASEEAFGPTGDFAGRTDEWTDGRMDNEFKVARFFGKSIGMVKVVFVFENFRICIFQKTTLKLKFWVLKAKHSWHYLVLSNKPCATCG